MQHPDPTGRDTIGLPDASHFGGQGLLGNITRKGDIFGDIFGGGRSNNKSSVSRGADLRYNMEITLEQAAKGTDSQIKNFTGTTFIFGDSMFIGSTTAGEPYFKGFADGAAELYHNSQKRLETTADGITLSGNIVLGDTPDTNTGTAGNRVRIGASNDLQLFHGPNNSYIRNDTGSFNIEQYANSTLDIFSNYL